jgi:OOP family OmpA-OmpF porin
MDIRVLAGTGILIAATSASASGWSVGGGLSGVVYDEEFCDTFSGTDIDCEDTDTGVKFFAGYDFNKNFRVEWFYADLGEARAEDVFGDFVSLEADGAGIAAMPMAPIAERWDLFGRLGLFSWDGTVEANVSGVSDSISDDGSDPFFGFGARYRLGDQGSFRLGWDLYELDDFEVTTFTVGFGVRF